MVREAWLRLGGVAQPDWQSRRHFGAAAQAMRQILIERASNVRESGTEAACTGSIRPSWNAPQFLQTIRSWR